MIRSTPLLALAVLTVLFAHGLAAGNVPALDPKEGSELIRQLGDESFAVREAASRKLFKLGLAARDVLLEGTRHPDPEIRKSCRYLLPAVLRAEHRARLEAFIADREDKQEHNLPGWKRFRQVAGNDAAARDLFVSIQRSQGVALLSNVEKHPKQAAELVQAQCQRLWSQMFFRPGLPHQPPTVPEVSALYLIAADPGVQLTPTAVNQLANLLNQPTIRTALLANQAPLRKLVVAWLMQQTNDTSFQQIGWILVNNTFNLPEAVEIGRKVLRGKKVRGASLALAMTVVGKHGKRSNLKDLEPFLNDRTLIGTVIMNNQRGTTQVRDVALAMMIHLSGQSQKDYGFAFLQPWMKFQYHWMGFANDTQRDQAFRKWKAWQAGQKK